MLQGTDAHQHHALEFETFAAVHSKDGNSVVVRIVGLFAAAVVQGVADAFLFQQFGNVVALFFVVANDGDILRRNAVFEPFVEAAGKVVELALPVGAFFDVGRNAVYTCSLGLDQRYAVFAAFVRLHFANR